MSVVFRPADFFGSWLRLETVRWTPLGSVEDGAILLHYTAI